MNRIVVASVFWVASAALAQPVTPTTGPSLTGTTQVVNNSPGDQLDPHVSNSLVSYTDFSSSTPEIRYQTIGSPSSDSAIPNDGAYDIVSDVNDTTIVYTHISGSTQAIFSFDTTNPGAGPTELDPQPGSLRTDATIGGNTVAWEDYGYDPSAAEIVAYDRASATAVRVTNDSAADVNPAVDPSGTTLAWTKCDSPGVNCHIWAAVKSGSSWSAHALTSGSGQEELPDTNGTLVAYDSIRSGEQDIYWQPVTGGAEHQLVFAGEDRNANIAGNFIAFEHRDDTAANPNWDIYVYDIAANILYQVTNTPNDEILNDVSVDASGNVRVVWAVQEATNGYNVYAFSFATPGASCTGISGDGDDDDENASDACSNPVGRPLLATVTIDRTTGAPNSKSVVFAATPTSHKGLICLESHGADTGLVLLNGETEFGPWNFDGDDNGHSQGNAHHSGEGDHDDGLQGRHVSLASSNTLGEWIAGKPGTSYTVRVYGAHASCPETQHHDDSISSAHDSLSTDSASTAAMGCSVGGGEVLIAGLLALIGAVLGRCRAAVPVRERRR